MTPLTAEHQTEQRIGQGRSGVVYRTTDGAGRDVARKVFGGDSLSTLVHYIFGGAPNPYRWSMSAVQCALSRRRILHRLLPLWFGDRLRVAQAYDFGYNEQHEAWHLDTQFVGGSHLALHHPYRTDRAGQLRDVIHDILRPLQNHLLEAGFDGLVWQAGRGNPVALNNFLRDDGGYVWIDLESGVPALAPINPIELLRFYLPKSFQHGRPLFDDVDLVRLRAYLAAQRGRFSADEFEQLQQDVDRLSDDQRRWKSMARHMRSICYRLGRGQISAGQADYYATRRLRWYAREGGRAVASAGHRTVKLVARFGRFLAGIEWRRIAADVWGLLSSQKFRVAKVRKYIASRIDAWQQRGQLDAEHADDLRLRLQSAESSRYLIDFGAHIAVKPFVKTLQWWVAPVLLATGVLDPVIAGVLIAVGGAVVRTIYTLCRCIQNAVKRREVPYLALFVGMMPVIGNLAFPLQIIFTSAHEHARVAQFLVYDTLTRIGRAVPIWGGADTLTEHLFNHLPDLLLRLRLPDADAA